MDKIFLFIKVSFLEGPDSKAWKIQKVNGSI